MQWVKDNADDEIISKSMEKAKKNFAGTELKGKKLGVIGLGAIGVLVANVARHFGMEIYGVDPFLSVNNALSLSRDVTVVKSYDELYRYVIILQFMFLIFRRQKECSTRKLSIR